MPTLFVRAPAKTQSDWVALDGTPVAPIKFNSMREAKEFAEKYEDVENFSIYGNTNYIAQFIAEEFPGDIQFDRSLVRIHNIDIEVNSNLKVDENGKLTSGGSGGFPEPSVAAHIVTAITIHDSVLDTFFVWGLGDYDVSKSLIRDRKISYTKCVNERALLQCFIDFWHNEFTCPDAVTGWNIRGFDIPYLVNRIKRVCGEDTVKKLSPWGLITEKMVTMRKGQVQMYEISGIAQLDYMDLFQKFGYSFGPQENYRLDTIADVVLGERKLDYSDQYANLAELYEKNHQLYLDYNIRDTWLVDRMEDKIAMITLCLTMSYKAGVNYGDAFGTTAIWDQLIHRFLLKDKIVVPPNKNKFKSDYDGGYVKDPQCGVHDWVCSFDVNSLYPNIIVQWNMSPETIISGVIEPGVDVERMLSGFKSRRTDASMAATGQYFSNKKQGFMPKIIEAMYDERVAIKKKMLEAKRQLEKVDSSNATELYAIERLVAQYENQQTAIKILLNSLYGALGNRFFRYFTMEIAEGITLTGQYIIRWSEKHINEYINKTLKTNKDYIIAIDTDSDYVDLGDLVKAVVPDASIDKKVDFLDKVCAKIETDVLDPAFKELKENCNAFKHRITMKREAIASRGIFCCHPDTKISTLQGDISIEDLYFRSKDTLEHNVKECGNVDVINFDEDSGVKHEDVIDLVLRREYSGDLYTITTEDGHSVSVTADHLILVVSNDSYSWVMAKDLKETDEVVSI